MPKRNIKLFIIPEEAPTNDHGLAIPPVSVECSKEDQSSCPYQGRCFEDRHHLYWEASLYTSKVFKGLRGAPFVVTMCRRVHDELHDFQHPPLKPSAEVARLAIIQTEIDAKIFSKYESINKKQSMMTGTNDKKLRKIQRERDRLLDEIDELKELKSMRFGNAGGVLPEQKYFIVKNVEVEQTINDAP